MTNCKRCNGIEHIIKSGIVRGKQRYCCKGCRCYFVVGDNRTERGYPPEIKALAVLLYGTMKSSYGMIAKLLGTTRKRVYLWIKKAGSQLPESSISDSVTEIEFDEMWHFIRSKKQAVDLESIRPLFEKVHRLGGRS